VNLKVEWTSPEDLEFVAEKLLFDYQATGGDISRPPIPIEDIIENKLGLELIVDDLRTKQGKPDILGCTYVEDKTICIDSSIQEEEGQYNFTCSHEVAHWLKHKDLYLAQRKQTSLLPREKEPIVMCRLTKAIQQVEYQANRIAAAILMPRKQVIEALKDCRQLLSGEIRHRTQYYIKSEVEQLARECALIIYKRFRVSIQTMQIRILELRLLNSIGTVSLL